MRKFLMVVSTLIAGITSSAYADDAAKNAFTLNTNAFLSQTMLPVLYTCDGKDVSPQFDWTNVPAKTKMLAMVVSDPDAPGGTFYHWVLYNIPMTTKALDEGVSKIPAGAAVAKNDFGKTAYTGPCPPKGTAHTYVFTLYGLDGKIDAPAGSDAKTVVAAIQKHTVGKVELSAVYSRWIK